MPHSYTREVTRPFGLRRYSTICTHPALCMCDIHLFALPHEISQRFASIATVNFPSIIRRVSFASTAYEYLFLGLMSVRPVTKFARLLGCRPFTIPTPSDTRDPRDTQGAQSPPSPISSSFGLAAAILPPAWSANTAPLLYRRTSALQWCARPSPHGTYVTPLNAFPVDIF